MALVWFLGFIGAFLNQTTADWDTLALTAHRDAHLGPYDGRFHRVLDFASTNVTVPILCVSI
jgi:hypothetical protein